jgi:Skp family chaperone for outer membrane proteins
MKYSLRAFLGFLFIVGLSTSLRAAHTPSRIAVIDVQAVLSGSHAGTASFEKLKKLQDDTIARISVMTEKIARLEAEARKETGAKAQARIDEAAKLRIEAKRQMENADKEIGAARDRELAALETKIKPVIEAVAAALELDAVFNKYESGMIFAADRIDITDAVIKQFNAANP